MFRLLIVFLFFPLVSSSQSVGRLKPSSPDAVAARKAAEKPLTVDSIRNAEALLVQYADSMVRGSSDAVRRAYCALFNPMINDLLRHEITFAYPFDSLKVLSKLKSPDGKVRVYTWFLQNRSTGGYEYYGMLQRINPKSGEFKVFGLMEQKHATDFAEINVFESNEWYGAVYYDIIERRVKKKTYYFLLGWHGVDRASTRKLIDVVQFDQWDNMDFGAPLFSGQPGPKIKYRVIFEFNANAVMLLRFEKSRKMLVFDHLSPSSPSLKGQFSSYGPDFTYDGYFFKKGRWIYKSNLDVKN
jgi:hypothetical protein